MTTKNKFNEGHCILAKNYAYIRNKKMKTYDPSQITAALEKRNHANKNLKQTAEKIVAVKAEYQYFRGPTRSFCYVEHTSLSPLSGKALPT